MMKFLVLILALLALTLAGCASLNDYGEHAQCLKSCEKKYRPSKEWDLEALCKSRCEREFGLERPFPK